MAAMKGIVVGEGVRLREPPNPDKVPAPRGCPRAAVTSLSAACSGRAAVAPPWWARMMPNEVL